MNKYTHKVTKIIHDDTISDEKKCKLLEPLILSYIFSSYRTVLPGCKPYAPHYLTGSYLKQQYKAKIHKFNVIEWGKVSEFEMTDYWKEKFKNYPDRQVLHFNLTFYDPYSANGTRHLCKEYNELDFYLSLKKFSKSINNKNI